MHNHENVLGLEISECDSFGVHDSQGLEQTLCNTPNVSSFDFAWGFSGSSRQVRRTPSQGTPPHSLQINQGI